MKDGFIKVAAASPVISLADTEANASVISETIEEAYKAGVRIIVFPELTVTGYTCGDFLSHNVLLRGAKEAVEKIAVSTAGKKILSLVGFPQTCGSRICSSAAAIYDGEIIGIANCEEDILFECPDIPGLKVGVELGSDSDEIVPPSYDLAAEGATVIARMASFPASVYSTKEEEDRLKADSKRLKCGIVSAAPGYGESTTDFVYTGLCTVAENGKILSEFEGEDGMAISELDIDYLMNMRRADGGFDLRESKKTVLWSCPLEETKLTRKYKKYPQLPEDPDKMYRYCERMIELQVSGLVRRMKFAHLDHTVVGISGGVDSTLAVIISALAVSQMGLPSENCIAVTMPCFGTSSRTKSNAVVVAEQLGADVRVIDISNSVNMHFDDIGHARDDYSVAFENAQARERTQVLMDLANKCNGLDVGTEDLSEYVDGWCTYNGDHTSMYDVNIGMTKTQVRAAVTHIAKHTENKVLAKALFDVLDCPVTPELLPIRDDMIEQKSEDAVGSYNLQDFFTWCVLRCGFTPNKTIRLANIAYNDEFTHEELVRWMTSWCKRYFTQQFKRSCLMDGPTIDGFSVSPRVGFLIPSDAQSSAFTGDIK